MLRTEFAEENHELLNEPIRCQLCFNTGVVTAAWRKPVHWRASFRCACGAADRLGNVARDTWDWSPELAGTFVFARTHAKALEVVAPTCACILCSMLKKSLRDPTGDPPGDASGDALTGAEA